MNPPVSLELIRPNPADVIAISCDYNTDLKEILDVIDVVVPAFPNNRVIFIPNGMSLISVNKIPHRYKKFCGSYIKNLLKKVRQANEKSRKT